MHVATLALHIHQGQSFMKSWNDENEKSDEVQNDLKSALIVRGCRLFGWLICIPFRRLSSF